MHSQKTSVSSNLLRRTELKNLAKDNQSLQIQLNATCAKDMVFWINNFVWTYDPRLDTKSKHIPFILFPRQLEYLKWRDERYINKERGIIIKSREIGASWLNAMWQLHHFLYDPGFKGGLGSRSENAVDNRGNLDSLFEKLRYALKYLPEWMLPVGYNPRVHDTFMTLNNPQTGASITGEAGDNVGRGGRSSILDIDEAAHLAHPMIVEAAICETSNCIIETSSAGEPGELFDSKVMGGVFPVFWFSWRDDPRKNEAWYEKKKLTLPPQVIAREYDMDSHGSAENVTVPFRWVSPCNGRDLHIEHYAAITIGGDVAEEGMDLSACCVRKGRNILFASEWRGIDADQNISMFIQIGHTFDTGRIHFFIDQIGIGSSVVSGLRRYIREKNLTHWVVLGVIANETKQIKDQLPLVANLKACLWWRMRDWFNYREPSISLEIDRKYRDKMCLEISQPKYNVDNGKITIESKKEMRNRGVKSGNMADALMHTFLYEVTNPVEDDTPNWMKGRRNKNANSSAFVT